MAKRYPPGPQKRSISIRVPAKKTHSGESNVIKAISIPRGRSSQEDDLRLKPRGASLKTKFALFTALAITIATLILVVTAYLAVKHQVETQINDGGIRVVKLFAAFDFSFWEDLKAKGKNPFSNIIGVNAEEMGIEIPSILNLIITDKNKYSIVGMNEVAIQLEDSRSVMKTKDNIKINEGLYRESISGLKIRTRSYQKPIMSQDGELQGYVILFLSAKKIDEILNEILISFLGPACLAIILGALLGLFMAGQVTRSVKTLMADMEVVSRGDLAHQSHAYSSDEIGVLAMTFNRMTKSLQLARKKEIEAKALERELELAHEVQSNLLPKKIPAIPGYDISAFYRSSHEVGGDYYDIIQVDENNIGVIVADVAGKGIPGSMLMTMTRSLVRMEATRNLSPADTLSKVNRILAADIRRGMFVTAMYLIMNIKARTILVSSAGHNPLIIWRHSRRGYELVNPNGIALGFDRGPVFERTVKEQLIQLAPGDRFVSYTDGVVEAMNPRDEEFGSERFYKLVGQLTNYPSKVFIDQTIKVLDNYKGSAPQHDDITLVSVRVTA